jgi:hypothetical protein
MRKSKKKLSLAKETIRSLEVRGLMAAAGGEPELDKPDDQVSQYCSWWNC